MKLIKEKIGEYGELTGYIHEPSPEMDNIMCYPAVLVIPGGGFRFCSDREAEPVALAYFAEGYQAFVLRYTTVTAKPEATMEDPMRDVQDAIAWIRSHKKEYYVAEKQLAMVGFSGGGHLSAAVATHGEERPDALILGYPGIIHSDLRALDCPDIIECVDEKTPPTFLFSTRTDFVTPPKHAMAFAKALDDAGIGFELHIFREGDHGLSLAKPLTSGGYVNQVNPSVAQWFKMSVDWLKAEFGEFTVDKMMDYSVFDKDKSESHESII